MVAAIDLRCLYAYLQFHFSRITFNWHRIEIGGYLLVIVQNKFSLSEFYLLSLSKWKSFPPRGRRAVKKALRLVLPIITKLFASKKYYAISYHFLMPASASQSLSFTPLRYLLISILSPPWLALLLGES